MKQNRPSVGIDLAKEVGASDAWGTALGADLFAKLNVRLLGLSEGTLVEIDQRRLVRSDASFQREAVVETLRKHRPRLLFIAVGVDDLDVRSNLEMALERRGDWLLALVGGKRIVLGGALSREHNRTLETVWSKGPLTAAAIVKTDSTVKLSTASGRLAWLWRAGLIERRDGTAQSGGREHTYLAIP